jgi:hypothetical protein
MPLLDHFHPPLSGRRHWEGFHNRWAAAMADSLNERLPADYYAEFQVKYGTSVEVDVATFSESVLPEPPRPNGAAVALQARPWSPQAPVAVMPAVFPDDLEVQIYSSIAGPQLVGAIELVSPANKDRPENRSAFIAKCAAYLQRGIGLIVVDIVTERHANLHDELMAFLGHVDGFVFPTPVALYATAYRPVHREQTSEIDLWRETLSVGQVLATLPLPVRGLGTLAIDLEATYMEARKRSRVA